MPSYSFRSEPFGFHVEHPRNGKVRVMLEPWRLVVTGERDKWWACGLYEGYALVREIADWFYENWEPPRDLPETWWSPVEWVKERIYRSLARRVAAERRRLLESVPAEVRAVQRAVFAVSLGSSWLAQKEALYRHPYIVRDVTRFRAAATALAAINELLDPDDNENEAAGCCWTRQGPDRKMRSDDERLAALANWRGLFSPTGRPYRSLNRTLAELPGGIPFRLVGALRRVHLERPVTSRLQFAALCQRAEIGRRTFDRSVLGTQLQIFQRATPAQIAAAVERVGEHTRRRLNPRRVGHVYFTVSFLADYPEIHRGELGGLVAKAIRWHRTAPEPELRSLALEMGLRQIPESMETKRPPFPLPTDPRIRFLGSVGEIIAEGVTMQHCIATRIASALRGQSFLFHADYGGESASIEVDDDGRILQAQGPRNRMNQAVDWATWELMTWWDSSISDVFEVNGSAEADVGALA